MGKHKFGAKAKTVDGIKFPSTGEANRYIELQRNVSAGKISELSLQPSFVLQEKFKSHGKTILSIKYVADFSYIHDHELIIEDFKGMQTPVFKIKQKMLLLKYPNINFLVVSTARAPVGTDNPKLLMA